MELLKVIYIMHILQSCPYKANLVGITGIFV